MFEKNFSSNKKIFIYTLIYTLIILFLQSDDLGDRDAYTKMVMIIDNRIENSNRLLNISEFGFFRYITSENIWNYILLFLKTLNLDPNLIIRSISCLVGFVTSYFVFRNSKNNLEIAFIYLINLFTLTSSLVHIRSGLAMCLVFITYEYPKLNKSIFSRLIRFGALGIHMGALIYLFMDFFHALVLKINSILGRSSVIFFGLATVLSSNLLFAILVRYQPNESTISGRGSFFGFGFYFILLLLLIFTNENQRNENYISIIILSVYLSFYMFYPGVSRILQMGYPFLIISIINIKSSSKKFLTLFFLFGNIFSLVLNYKLLYI